MVDNRSTRGCRVEKRFADTDSNMSWSNLCDMTCNAFDEKCHDHPKGSDCLLGEGKAGHPVGRTISSMFCMTLVTDKAPCVVGEEARRVDCEGGARRGWLSKSVGEIDLVCRTTCHNIDSPCKYGTMMSAILRLTRSKAPCEDHESVGTEASYYLEHTSCSTWVGWPDAAYGLMCPIHYDFREPGCGSGTHDELCVATEVAGESSEFV